MSNIKFKLTPSFCNKWPLIRVTINDIQCWEQYVDVTQTVQINFEPIEKNFVKIEYLNKRQGPDIWDTKLDSQGKIIEDQYCILSDIMIANSRCDFLTHSLVYTDSTKKTHSNLLGFMSRIGYYEFSFPNDIYNWIANQRMISISSSSSHTSALGYFSNPTGANNDPITQSLLTDIRNLIDQI